jgi:hypothetical protein
MIAGTGTYCKSNWLNTHDSNSSVCVYAHQPNAALSFPALRVSESCSNASGNFLWTWGPSVARSLPKQDNKNTRIHPRPERDSNPRFKARSWTFRPLKIEYHVASRRHDPITQWRSVVSQKNVILDRKQHTLRLGSVLKFISDNHQHLPGNAASVAWLW